MEFKFSPEFEPLIKFTKGLPKVPVNADDIIAVAKYLGVDLSDVALDDDRIKLLSEELSFQNGFYPLSLAQMRFMIQTYIENLILCEKSWPITG